MSEKKVPGVSEYAAAAGGWGALRAVTSAVRELMGVGREASALKRVNQQAGFDCSGCAWPDPQHTSSFEFCENGTKAVTWGPPPSAPRPSFSPRMR